jgi:uncharacterized protein YndB with AHSA1/START domain
MESIRLTTTFSATPDDVFDAWVTGARHAAMTGSPATSEKRKGGSFTAWDGYASGKHLELEPGKRILQSWRTTDFPERAPDSRLEIRLAKVARGTRLTLLQGDIPDGQSEMYSDGWQEHYFEPMRRYFRETSRAKANAGTTPRRSATRAKTSKAKVKGAAAQRTKAGPAAKAGKKTSRAGSATTSARRGASKKTRSRARAA